MRGFTLALEIRVLARRRAAPANPGLTLQVGPPDVDCEFEPGCQTFHGLAGAWTIVGAQPIVGELEATTATHWVEIYLVDENNEVISGQRYLIISPDGRAAPGSARRRSLPRRAAATGSEVVARPRGAGGSWISRSYWCI